MIRRDGNPIVPESCVSPADPIYALIKTSYFFKGLFIVHVETRSRHIATANWPQDSDANIPVGIALTDSWQI